MIKPKSCPFVPDEPLELLTPGQLRPKSKIRAKNEENFKAANATQFAQGINLSIVRRNTSRGSWTGIGFVDILASGGCGVNEKQWQAMLEYFSDLMGKDVF